MQRARRTLAGIRAGDASSRLPAHRAQWHRHVSCSGSGNDPAHENFTRPRCKNAHETTCNLRCGRLPLRGQHRLARPVCFVDFAPCFPFDCIREIRECEHQKCGKCRSAGGGRQETADLCADAIKSAAHHESNENRPGPSSRAMTNARVFCTRMHGDTRLNDGLSARSRAVTSRNETIIGSSVEPR